jgi:hypothetical protein
VFVNPLPRSTPDRRLDPQEPPAKLAPLFDVGRAGCPNPKAVRNEVFAVPDSKPGGREVLRGVRCSPRASLSPMWRRDPARAFKR